MSGTTLTVLVVVSALLAITAAPAHAQDAPFPVAITIDAGKTQGELHPIWRFLGYDEPNYTYMKDGKKLLAEFAELAKPHKQQVYVRTHSLLCSGDGVAAMKWGSSNAYTEDAQGNPVYDWTIVDRIFDTYRERGLRPYAQIGFMPKDLSSHPEPYQHHWKPGDKYDDIFTGWAYPPKDYTKWGNLVYEWVKHCVEKYGKEEVEQWYWEVWNESNIGYWKGTPEEFRKVHDYAVDGVRRALPTARVGGPDAAGDGGRFTRAFLEHCLTGTNYATGKQGTPIDFISFHAKGAPTVVDGRVRMGIRNELATIDRGFGIVASYPELKDKPIVIGECDPDGCAACGAKLYPSNNYRNSSLYASYTAASFSRIHDIAAKHGVNIEGALTWAFEFEDQPFFAGYRVLATNGIDLPVLNVFRMFGMMTGQRVSSESNGGMDLDSIIAKGVREKPDVSALASLGERKLYVILWHYHDDAIPGPVAEVTVSLKSLPADAKDLHVQQYRIDDDHSNSYTAWQKMGSPEKPTQEQYAQLEAAGKLQELEGTKITIDQSTATLQTRLPRQSVSLLVFSW